MSMLPGYVRTDDPYSAYYFTTVGELRRLLNGLSDGVTVSLGQLPANLEPTCLAVLFAHGEEAPRPGVSHAPDLVREILLCEVKQYTPPSADDLRAKQVSEAKDYETRHSDERCSVASS